MAPHESVKKSNKKISDEAEALQKYLELKKVSVPSLKNLTAINYGRPAEKHNEGIWLLFFLVKIRAYDYECLKQVITKFTFDLTIKLVSALKSLGNHHVGSFNYMLDEGLKIAIQDIDPIEFIYDATGKITNPKPNTKGHRVSESIISYGFIGLSLRP